MTSENLLYFIIGIFVTATIMLLGACIGQFTP